MVVSLNATQCGKSAKLCWLLSIFNPHWLGDGNPCRFNSRNSNKSIQCKLYFFTSRKVHWNPEANCKSSLILKGKINGIEPKIVQWIAKNQSQEGTTVGWFLTDWLGHCLLFGEEHPMNLWPEMHKTLIVPTEMGKKKKLTTWSTQWRMVAVSQSPLTNSFIMHHRRRPFWNTAKVCSAFS